MNLDNLNKWLMLAANLGVIGGIILLAVELQQNNELLQSQARAARHDARTGVMRMRVENPIVGETISRFQNGEELLPQEIANMMAFVNFMLTGWEYLWSEYDAGLLDISELGIESRREAWNNFPDEIKERWLEGNGLYNPAFIVWMEENIINP